jgi:uncharacterized membrane protein YraQ (UPF0718 family)
MLKLKERTMSDITQGQAGWPKVAPMKIIKSVPFAIILILALVAIFDAPQWLYIVGFAINAFFSTLPFILIAVGLIGFLKATGSETLISRAFEGREIQAIFLAALIGGLSPFCSCQVIPFIAGLLTLGAPLSAVMAFWLSSPLIDPPSFVVTGSILGWEFAISKAAFAVSLGLLGGFAIKLVGANTIIANPLKDNYKRSTCGAGKFKGKPNWTFWREEERVAVFKKEGLSNLLFLSKWLAFAYVMEALLVTYVPASFVAQFVGGEGPLPIAIAALVGAPAYLNSYAAIPLVNGLMEQGMTAGAAMSFMVAGSVSSIPAMTAVFSLVKKQIFALYLGFGIFGAMLFGAIYQYLIGYLA